MTRKGIAAVVGWIFVSVAIYLIIAGIAIYADQKSQEAWNVRMATVTRVEQRRESTGVRHSRSRIVYDIDYEYNDGDNTYTGQIVGTVDKKEVGDLFDIKCDPVHPENSTDILDPQPDALILNIGGGCVFLIVGLLLTGLPARLLRRKTGSVPLH